MAIKTFTTGEVLTAADTNTYLANSGLVFVTQASATGLTTSINNCFTSAYSNYRIIVAGTAATNASTSLSLRFRAGGADNNAANHKWSLWYTTSGGLSGVANANAGTEIITGYISSANGNNHAVMDIINPQVNTRTTGTWQRSEYDGGSWVTRNGGFMKDAIEQYDGFSIIAGAGTFTGTIYVYGYRNS